MTQQIEPRTVSVYGRSLDVTIKESEGSLTIEIAGHSFTEAEMVDLKHALGVWKYGLLPEAEISEQEWQEWLAGEDVELRRHSSGESYLS